MVSSCAKVNFINTQFEYINEQAKKFIAEHEPVISIDSKKKENIGDFKNNGAEWRKSKEPVKVLGHDFQLIAAGVMEIGCGCGR